MCWLMRAADLQVNDAIEKRHHALVAGYVFPGNTINKWAKNMKELRKKGLSLRVKEETRITQALYRSRFREKSLEFVAVNKRC